MVFNPGLEFIFMNATVNALYADYLKYTDGDKAAAASLTLAAILCDRLIQLAPGLDRPLTISEVAKLLRIQPNKVLNWVRDGELRGYNVATKQGKRPRYRINPEDLTDFQKRRTILQPVPKGRPPGSYRRIPIIAKPILDTAKPIR